MAMMVMLEELHKQALTETDGLMLKRIPTTGVDGDDGHPGRIAQTGIDGD
jgi:hypothetical protein